MRLVNLGVRLVKLGMHGYQASKVGPVYGTSQLRRKDVIGTLPNT